MKKGYKKIDPIFLTTGIPYEGHRTNRGLEKNIRQIKILFEKCSTSIDTSQLIWISNQLIGFYIVVHSELSSANLFQNWCS